MQAINHQTIFDHKKNPDLYWQALVDVANGDKDAALKIVEAIHSDKPIIITAAWKEDRPENIDDFFDKLFLAFVSRDPQLLSFLNLFESIGIREHNAHLTDLSTEAFLHNLAEAKKNLSRLNGYSVDDLSEEQKLSHKIFSWMLNHKVAGENFLFHDYTLNQMDGILTSLPVVLTQFHKIETVEDAENFISRLNKIQQQFQQVIEFIELQKTKGIVLPRFAVEKILTIIEKSTPDDLTTNIFYSHLQEQLTKLNLPNKDALLEQVKKALEQSVYPAYRALHIYFTHLLTIAQTNHGVWALPNGNEFYHYALRHHTTTNLSADEIHALGLREVALIQKEMHKILADENLDDPKKSAGILVQELSEKPEFYYPNTKEGREQCLADFGKILDRSREELSHLFGIKPKSGVTIQKVPAHEEEGSPAACYYPPSADGTRPGIFFANLRDMGEIPKHGMETLTIHEAEPGHHFQLALQYEMNIPMLRKLGSYNAFAEGWALYAEKLAYEQGFYSSSFSKLGHLRDELMRAVRLVVDTGIHHKRWTREQAIDYMQEQTGYHQNSVITEIERYFVWPGQACAYKIGQLKILELRKRAQEQLGENFDIREFHDAILKAAEVPLAILEEVVDRYIMEKSNLENDYAKKHY
jgi:uncharacterized protein (DUF885 family)